MNNGTLLIYHELQQCQNDDGAGASITGRRLELLKQLTRVCAINGILNSYDVVLNAKYEDDHWMLMLGTFHFRSFGSFGRILSTYVPV